MGRKEYHHGYLLTGSAEKALGKALKMAGDILGREENFLFSHPDFYFLEAGLFAISNAREIREKSSKKSFEGRGRVFVVKSNYFSREAGNALLKTLEEPAGLSYFFLVTNSPENILETLRSRLVVLNFEAGGNLPEGEEETVERFLKSSVDKRLEMAREIAADREKALRFLNVAEFVLRKKGRGDFFGATAEPLIELAECRRFLFQKSSSPKMILEHISLVLPIV